MTQRGTHTPGPWTWGTQGKYGAPNYAGNMPALLGADDTVVMHFGDSEQYYPTEGCPPEGVDKNLIEAAPERREILADWIAGRGGIDKARALLARIDGTVP